MAVASLVTRGVWAPANVVYNSINYHYEFTNLLSENLYRNNGEAEVAQARTNLIIKHEQNNCPFYLYACEIIIFIHQKNALLV